MKKLLVGLVAAAAIVAACSNTTTATPPVVASVTVVPASESSWVVSDTMLLPRLAQLAAVLKDAGGHVLSIIQTGQSVVWTSSDSTVAKVSRYGVATGVAPGSVTITAATEGQNGTSAVSSIAVSVAAVSVKPAPDSVAVGKTVTLKATPTRANGDTLVAKKMFWASSDTTVAIVTSIDSLGVAPGNTAVIKGRAVGTATITATISGVNGTSLMKVQP
jgi:uncharacterized protein YjdB